MLNTIVEVDTPEIPREDNQRKILVFILQLRYLHNQHGAENNEKEMRTS